jgi:hypothetical protein
MAQTPQPEKRGRGRPPKYGRAPLPPGSRQQSYRGTDEEHAALMLILAKMRTRKQRETKGK